MSENRRRVEKLSITKMLRLVRTHLCPSTSHPFIVIDHKLYQITNERKYRDRAEQL